MLLDTSFDNSGAAVEEVGTVVVTDVVLELDTVSSDTVVVLEAEVSNVSGMDVVSVEAAEADIQQVMLMTAEAIIAAIPLKLKLHIVVILLCIRFFIVRKSGDKFVEFIYRKLVASYD